MKKLSDLISQQYIVVYAGSEPYSHDLSNNEIEFTKIISDTDISYQGDIESESVIKTIHDNGDSDLGDENKVRVLELVDAEGCEFTVYAPEWWM